MSKAKPAALSAMLVKKGEAAVSGPARPDPIAPPAPSPAPTASAPTPVPQALKQPPAAGPSSVKTSVSASKLEGRKEAAYVSSQTFKLSEVQYKRLQTAIFQSKMANKPIAGQDIFSEAFDDWCIKHGIRE